MDRIQINNNIINSGTTELFIPIRIGQNFETSLYKNEVYNKAYAEKIEEESINQIIDYEKDVFYPTYISAGTLDVSGGSFIKDGLVRVNGDTNVDPYMSDIESLNFNVYLRRRMPVSGYTEGDEYVDYGSWQSSDELYWTSFDYDSGNTCLVSGETTYTGCGDLLGYLGFNDDDVFYQKRALKKSFIRISIYDTPYRQTQKLLYYSTIFLDSNVLYKKYTTQLDYDVLNDTRMHSAYTYTVASPESISLSTTFTATNKYNQSSSSDGFYLYLFNNVVTANKATPLYMKFEFNNAKYGKTVPLTCPRDNDNNPLSYNSSDFPLNYISETESGSTKYYNVDMNKLYKDLYTPIFVRYNHINKRFEWTIASKIQTPASKNGILTIDLFEPRINDPQQL